MCSILRTMLACQVHEGECGLLWIDVCDVSYKRVARRLGDGNSVPCVDCSHDGMCGFGVTEAVMLSAVRPCSVARAYGRAMLANIKGGVDAQSAC